MNRIIKNITLLLVVLSVSITMAQEKRSNEDGKAGAASEERMSDKNITKGNVVPDGVKPAPVSKGAPAPKAAKVAEKAQVKEQDKPKEAKLKWYQKLGFRGKDKAKKD